VASEVRVGDLLEEGSLHLQQVKPVHRPSSKPAATKLESFNDNP